MRHLSLFLFGIVSSLLALGTALASPIDDGLNTVAANSGVPTAVNATELRPFIGNTLRYVVNHLALAAVVTIVIAGILLIVGLGTDQARERAKKIIIYTFVGLVLIFFTRVIVAFVLNIPT